MQDTYINSQPRQVIPRADQFPRVLRHQYDVKPTWGLAWGLFWRFFVISMLFYIPIAVFLYFMPVK